jgi:ribose transport system ATP-binding protein/rhamnose transport system ATP-binding protein/inositol transport system ATP-binding protein
MMTGRTLQQVYPGRESPHSERLLLDVRKLYTVALRDITFQLLEGQILGIAGLNGSA